MPAAGLRVPAQRTRAALACARVGAVSSVALGLVVLAGWTFRVRELTTLSADGVLTVKPNTAFGFVLLGIAIYCVTVARTHVQRVGGVLGLVVMLVGVLVVAEYASGASFGIDDLAFSRAVSLEPGSWPGRMAVSTAWCLACLGAAVALRSSTNRHVTSLVQLLAGAAFATGFLALLGHAFGAPALYRVQANVSMTRPTAATIVVLAMAVVCANPRVGWLRVALADSAGGAVLRRVVPVVVIAEVALGAFRLYGQNQGWYGSGFGLAITVAGSILVFAAVTWRTAAQLHALDGERAELVASLQQRVEERTAELAAANAELSRSNADLEDFASVAAHDLKSPLATIGGLASLLQHGNAGELSEDGQLYVDHVVNGVRKLQVMVDDLLEYAKVGRAGTTTHVGADEILAEGQALLEADIKAADARIEVVGTLPELEGDPAQLRQLFTNLLGNAVKFRRPDVAPLVQVSAQELDGGRWVFRVRDNGIGIDPRFHDRIFKMFHRLHAGDSYEGTGIGLAICRRVVENHGGEIWVEESPGGGTTFAFTLPVRSGVTAHV